MISFTLDTNCIIEIDDNRTEADDVRALAQAHLDGRADVAIVAVSASERQQGDRYLETYGDFRERLAVLELAHLTEIQGLAYFDISYWGHALWSSDELTSREFDIHSILFPNVPFRWSDFAVESGIDGQSVRSPQAKRWRNAFCDRQMFWAHDHAKRDIFVTRDGNFSRLEGQAEFPNAKVLTPKEAALLI